MPLHIGGTGNGKLFVRFSPKADKLLLRGADGQDKELERPIYFIWDADNTMSGWLLLKEGQPPQRVMDPDLDHPAPCPGEGYKRGFVTTLFSLKFFGGMVEFSSISVHVCTEVRELYASIEAGRSSNPGKLPVVAFRASKPMKDRRGVNYRPVLEIVDWVDRPAELPDVKPVSDAEIYKKGGDGSGNGSGSPPSPPEPRRSPDPPKDPIF
jgi:hypothetical protein